MLSQAAQRGMQLALRSAQPLLLTLQGRHTAPEPRQHLVSFQSSTSNSSLSQGPGNP